MSCGRLLVVEDDLALRDVLARGLREEGFSVVTARDGGSAMQLANGDLVALVLDIGLPDTDGRDLCQALRARGIDAPVLFLTAADRLTDRLSGFAAGGDDYLSKPFHLAELVARLRALLRRSVSGPVTDSDVYLDPSSHSLVTSTATLPLTPTEFRLLGARGPDPLARSRRRRRHPARMTRPPELGRRALLAAPGRVLRRQELVRAGWADGSQVHDNTLDQYASRLRRKLAEAGAVETISTARGVGYRYA